MGKALKRVIAPLLALIIAIAAFAVIPPVQASAASTIKYSLSYTKKYVKLTLTPRSSSNRIYYTTDGKAPSIRSRRYTKTLAASAKVTVRAVEYNAASKKVASIKVTIAPRVQAPKFSVSFSGGRTYLKITSATSGAKIYYTTDGSTPTKKSKLYSSKISYTPGVTVNAKAFKSGFTSSKMKSYYEEPEDDEEEEDEEQWDEDYDEDFDEENDDGGVTELDSSDDKKPSGSGTTTEDKSADEVEGVFDLINKERSSAGVSSLKLDSALCTAADIRAKELVNLYSHTRPDGRDCGTVLDENGITYMARGENIAYGMNTMYTAPEVMECWMNSTGHRANILSTMFGKVGIGRYVSGANVYWVQIFTD